MEFRNERTWQNAVETSRTEEFHAAYEAAVDKVRADFGQKHPMIIGGQDVGPRRRSRTRAPRTRTSSSASSRKEAGRIPNTRSKPQKPPFPNGPRPCTRTGSDSFNAPLT